MQNNKIILINPPIDFNKTLGKAKNISKYTAMPPLGLAYIAAFLLSKGIEVKIIDAYADNLTIIDIVNMIPPNSIVGISVVTPTVPYVTKIAERLKNKKCRIILGGAHICVRPNDIECDIAIKGDGEKALYEFVTKNKIKDLILDDLPFPAYQLLPCEKYKAPPHWAIAEPVYFMFATRGCPFHCSFCAAELINNNRRKRSVDNVIAEITYAITEYGARQIMFQDTCFPLERQYIIDICTAIIKNKLKFVWTTSTRVDIVDEYLLKTMHKAGCRIINYGIESGNQEILNKTKKGFTLEKVKKAVESTHKIGIKTFGTFILGLPGDTLKTCNETIEFAKSLPLDYAQFYMCVPYPGSSIFEGNTNWEQYSTMKSMTSDDPIYTPDGITKNELVALQKKAYREFYFRPIMIWNHLKSMNIKMLPQYFDIGRILVKT